MQRVNVIFRRSGERRYAVIIERPDQSRQVLEPAPGYDPDIPHDLVHYMVEAVLGLDNGVFGRAVRGGGSFRVEAGQDADPRERIRLQRKQRRREQRLSEVDGAAQRDMMTSERLAGLCDVAWRRRHGQRPDPALWKPAEQLSDEDRLRVEQVVSSLDAVAEKWKRLPVGGELTFAWPNVDPSSAKSH